MSEDKTAAPSGGSSLLTAAVVAPVALAVVGPLWYHLVMDDGEKDTVLALLIQHGVPEDCFADSLPSSSCINQSFPLLIISIVALMALYTFKTFFLDKPSQAVLDIIEQEFDKRHEVLQGLLEELKDCFVADEGDEDIEIFNSEMLFEKIVQLIELPNYDKQTCEDAFKWLWIVLLKDFRVSLKLTKEGEDVRFSDGKQLQDLVKEFDSMVTRAYDQGFAPKGDERKQLYKFKWEAIYYLKIHGWKTVNKAFKMAMKAKEAFPYLIAQTVGTTVTAALSPMKLHYRAQVLESLGDTEGSAFWEAAKAMVLIELLSTVLDLTTDMIKVQAETLANKEIQIAYYDGLLKMPVSFWSRQAGLDWDEKITFMNVYQFGWDVTAFLEIPQKALGDLVTALSYAFLILQTSSRSLFLLLAANFGSTILFWVLDKISSRLHTLSQNGVIKESEEDFACAWFSLDPDYISTYLSFVRGPAEIKRFAKMKTSEAELGKRRNLVKVFSSPLKAVVSHGSEIAQFSTARTNVIQSGMGIADADAMVRSAESFVEQTHSIGGLFSDVIEKAKPLAKAYDVITLPRTIDPDTGLWPKGRAKGHIEFKDVRFKYPRRDAEVLKGVTFKVNPGDTIGMTGSAGCGKSTCMRLLERFYDVSEGIILLDGVDIREYNPRWLRGQIATVAQEPKLVPVTIRENLTFGCTKQPSLEEICDALKAANIYDSIMDKEKFPQGLRTQLESAGNVSGGEKQRIAIARAILADPPILLLDEATSALDEENQAKVQDALEKLMKGRTTMVIAHRLSTIKDSSKLVCFDKGKVFEEGKHDELLKTDGSLYRKLWDRQLSKRGGDDPEDEGGDEEGEEEEVEPLPFEAGMNPKPTALRRLETMLQEMDDSDPYKKEMQQIRFMLEKEEQGRVVGQRGIQRTAVDKWKQKMGTETTVPAANKNFKRLANKVVFKNLHASVTEKLDSVEPDLE